MKLNNLRTALLLSSVLTTAATLMVDTAAKAQPAIGIHPGVSTVVAQFPPFESRMEPDGFVTPFSGTVSVTLLNTAPYPISFILPGEDSYTTLQTDEEVALGRLELPAQVGFRQSEGIPTLATIVPSDPDADTIMLEFSRADSSSSATTTLIVDESGAIYLN